MWGDGVMGLGIREALFAAEIGKLTNSLGGGMDKKGGEIGTTWTTILNNFLAWKYENLRIFYSDICILSQISLKRVLLDVFNADIDVLLTTGASQCSQANLDKH